MHESGRIASVPNPGQRNPVDAPALPRPSLHRKAHRLVDRQNASVPKKHNALEHPDVTGRRRPQGTRRSCVRRTQLRHPNPISSFEPAARLRATTIYPYLSGAEQLADSPLRKALKPTAEPPVEAHPALVLLHSQLLIVHGSRETRQHAAGTGPQEPACARNTPLPAAACKRRLSLYTVRAAPCPEPGPITQPPNHIALKAALRRIVEPAPRKSIRKILLSGKRVWRIVVVAIALAVA